MTFEEFKATRRYVANVAEATGFDMGPDVSSGYVYADDLHIFDMPNGRYMLVIWCDQTVSDDLEALERRLYEFASDDEIFN